MNNSSTAQVRIALLGLGTVGGALHDVLLEHREHILHATDSDIEVVAALVRDASAPRDLPANSHIKLVDTIDAIIDAKPSIVCEALGGTDPARQYVLALLNSGINVVTANKQLVARHGSELFAAAEKSGSQLRFEASVCAAIPVIRMLRESLAAARVEQVVGILNGTTNYMLDEMTLRGLSYDNALAQAQELGYAEPDPTDDVEGIDAAAKLAILAGIAFGTTVSVADVATTGIPQVTDSDINQARTLGYGIRLIGRAELAADDSEGGIRTDVTPALVPLDHALMSIHGATNAVLMAGSPFGELVVQGAGAGGPETASAMAGDVVSILGSTPSFLHHDPHRSDRKVLDSEQRTESMYVRLTVADEPGVLAKVAGELASDSVSIAQVVQQLPTEGTAQLVLLTHPTTRRAVLAALGRAKVADSAVVLPILEETT